MPPTKQMVTRPSDDGFYLPAEWCRHARTWVAWPGSDDAEDAAQDGLKDAIANVVNTIRRHEPVTVVAPVNDHTDLLQSIDQNVDVVTIPHESVRLRDSGPTFLVDGKGGSAAVDWVFDGWAGSVPSWQDDAIISHRLLGQAEIRRFRAPLTLEGTAFSCDGEGTVIVLATTALSRERNNGISKLDGYDILCRWLGVSRVIWIEQGIGDGVGAYELRHTCTFVNPAHVFVGEQPNGQWGDTLDAVANRLNQAEDAHGRRIKVERLPVVEKAGQICTYTTFYVLNTAALVPVYDVPEDDIALKRIEAALPGRSVQAIPATDIVKAGASLSCIAQYQPARLLERNKATLLPKSAWQRPVPDYVGLLEAYIERVESENEL